MKPHVICHMVSSVDGRTLIPRWRPADAHRSGVFDRLHEQLGGDAWLVGRITGQEYAKQDAYPAHTDQRYPREPWFARRDAAAYGVVLDAHGKIAWGRTDIGDDPIVAVLTAQVADAHVAGLRQDGVSYIFAGKQDLDLGLALEILNRELGLQRVLLEGGGVTNGAFLRAGLIDELSLVIFPAVDGAQGAPCVFDSCGRCGRHISPAPRDDARKQSGTGGWGGVAALPTAERLTHACERLRPSHHCIERRGKCNYSRLIPRLFSSPGNPAQKQS